MVFLNWTERWTIAALLIACYIPYSMKSDDDDASVIRRILEGDGGAFRILVDRYSDRLFHFCMARLGDQSDAEDAVQDVFVRAYRSLRTFDVTRNWSSWLFAIAANRVKSRYANRVSSTTIAERAGREAILADEMASDAIDPEQQVLDILAAEALRSAVASLPESYRAPVELYYFAGLSVSEIASTLGAGTEAIKTRLFRARKELSRILDDSRQPTGIMKGRH
jgi:RNA polymerase sigma-70 factor (ECF subfamily)